MKTCSLERQRSYEYMIHYDMIALVLFTFSQTESCVGGFFTHVCKKWFVYRICSFCGSMQWKYSHPYTKKNTYHLYNIHSDSTYIYIYVYIYVHVYIFMFVFISTYIYIPTYLPTYIHTYLPTYLRTYIHTYTRTPKVSMGLSAHQVHFHWCR